MPQRNTWDQMLSDEPFLFFYASLRILPQDYTVVEKYLPKYEMNIRSKIQN